MRRKFERTTPPEPYKAPPVLPPGTSGSYVLHKGLGPPRIDLWTREEIEKRFDRKRRWFGSD